MNKRSITLIEIVVSMAILSVLVLLISSSTLVLRGATVESGLKVQMEGVARRVLTEFRREIRSSGFKQDGTPQFEIRSAGVAVADGVAGDTIVFRKRRGPDETDGSATGWSEQITYARVADPEPYRGIAAPVPQRFRLQQLRGPLTIPMAQDISGLSFTRVDGTILVRLELTHNNPHWGGGTPPPAITRVYEDQIKMLNRQ